MRLILSCAALALLLALLSGSPPHPAASATPPEPIRPLWTGGDYYPPNP